MKNTHFDKELDTCGLLCPWPLIHTKKILLSLTEGQILRVISTDPSSILDFKVFVAKTDHTLIDNYELAGKYYYFIKKK